MAKNKLSVCMIVKNEEKNLRRCLDSFMGIKGWCDQLVIVDTGSEDSTPDIAREYGAELYFHPWKGNFSEARNNSLRYAKCDWILTIDADEELCGEVQEFRKFKRELEKVKVNCVTIRMIDMIKGNQPVNTSALRVFRKGKVTFKNIVHNQPVVEGGNRAVVYAGSLHFKHYGYDLAPEEMKAKYERTVGLLKKRLEIDPEDIQAYFYLAQIYGFYNDDENCLKCCEIYMREIAKQKTKREDIHESIYALMINLLLKKGGKENLEKAYRYLLPSIDLLPLDLDLAYAQMQYGITTEDHLQLMIGIFRFIKNYEIYNREDSIKERKSRFIFTYSQHHIGTVMYYASHFFLTFGMNSLNMFDNILTQTTSLSEMEKSLKESLLNIGIDWKRKQQ